MDFLVPHEVTYDFDGRATVGEVAKALVAQDRLFREALAVIQRIYPKLELTKIEVVVHEVTHASPLKSQLVALVLGVYSAELGTDMPDILETLTGGLIDVSPAADSFVSVIVLLLAIHYGDKVRAKFFPNDDEKILKREKERLLVAAAAGAQVPRGTVNDAIEQAGSKRVESLVKASGDFLSPARRHHARAIRSGGEEISREAIEAFPSDAEMAMFEPTTQTDELERTLVQFYAHDREKAKKWAAVVEDVSPRRLPLHLAPHIKPEALFDRKEVRADVLVTSVRDNEGDYAPTLYILTKVYDDD